MAREARQLNNRREEAVALGKIKHDRVGDYEKMRVAAYARVEAQRPENMPPDMVNQDSINLNIKSSGGKKKKSKSKKNKKKNEPFVLKQPDKQGVDRFKDPDFQKRMNDL